MTYTNFVVHIFLSVILLSPCFVLSNPARNRRQSSTTYLIDTYVVVDNVMYLKFKQWFDSQGSGSIPDAKLKEYVSLVLHQVNTRLTTLNLTYSVSLQLVDINLNVSILDKIGNDKDGRISSDEAQTTFKNWIINLNLGALYDHALLLTGVLLGNTSSVSGEVMKGISYTREMCDQSGLSSTVVQENGGFQSVFYVAHEIGHSIGAKHDEEVPGCISDHYIMSTNIGAGATTSNVNHPWYFSKCSSTDINSYITDLTSVSTVRDGSLPPNCLKSNLTPLPEFTNTLNVASGQLYIADTQCQMIYGNKSKACLDNAKSLEDICSSLFCLDPSSARRECFEYFAAEGTSCGSNKWCRLGSCVYSDKAPSLDSQCPFGDSIVLLEGKNCSMAISERPWLCYKEDYQKLCCGSCKRIRTNSQACPYGDTKNGCNKKDCKKDESYDQSCCGTCSNNDVGCSIDGVQCEERVSMDQRQGCYNSTVANSCCSKTCEKYLKNNSGCKYGNYLLDDSCNSVKQTDAVCANKSLDCCESCSNNAARTYFSMLSFTLLLMLCAFL